MNFLLIGAIVIMLVIVIYIIESGGLIQMCADAFTAIIVGGTLIIGAALAWFICVVFDF